MILLKLFILSFISFCAAEYNNSMSRSYKGSYCKYNDICQNFLGIKSECIANECQCSPHYHINNNNTCIRDKGLREICTSSDECYWGPEMVDKIECFLGVCSCVPDYVPDQGKICVRYFPESAADTNVILTPMVTFTVVLSLYFN